MKKYERMARIEGIDLDTGTFTMTLATEGEASDGHILSIKGGQIPERMPMLTSHWNEPTAALGSITDPQKLLKDKPPRLRAVGHIEMTGEGSTAEIRRDIAHMIDRGHVTGMSIRWDDVPGKTIRRVNLPSDHPHFVDEKTAEGPQRWGLFFEEWIAREGSVVALGADPQALIGRAEETEGEVRAFWRAMADDAELNELERRAWQRPDPAGYTDKDAYLEDCIPMVMAEGKSQDEAVAQCNGMWENREEPEDESPSAKIAASLAALRIDAADCREAGASHADCINAVTSDLDGAIEAVDLGEYIVFHAEPVASLLRELLEHGTKPKAEVLVSPDEMESLLERLEALESRVASALDEKAVPEVAPASPQLERVKAEPLPADPPKPNEIIDLLIKQLREAHAPAKPAEDPEVIRPHELVEFFDRRLAAAQRRVNDKMRAEVAKARGKVSPNG